MFKSSRSKRPFLMRCMGAFLALSLPVFAQAQVSGTVFRDFNANGVKDNTSTYHEIGEGGITINAYNSAGTLLATQITSTVTATLGQYSFPASGANSIASGTAVRLEFILPTYYYATSSSGTVQFATAGTGVTANLGLNYPNDYNSSTNPLIATSVYSGGYGTTTNALVGFPYNSTGTTAPTNSYGSMAQVGTTWGLAYQRTTGILFASAFVKRHAGLGPQGLGGIYKVNRSATTQTATNFVDVTASPISINVGSVLDNVSRGLTTTASDFTHDPSTFDQIGKVGIGDLEISEDDNTLYFSNLYDQKIYAIDIATQTKVAAFSAGIALPTTPVSNGVLRPWGLKVYKGKLYVGAVATGENSGTTNDLFAYIFVMDLATNTFSSTPALKFPLNYPKLDVDSNYGAGLTWMPWVNSFTATIQYPGVQGSGSYDANIYPQPILSGIDFDADGSMVISFCDRLGHQFSYQNGSTDISDTYLYDGEIGGGLYRVYNNNGTFELENNGVAGGLTTTTGNQNNISGPGTINGAGTGYTAPYGKFYDLYNANAHNDAGVGGVAILVGSDQVMATSMDPRGTYQTSGLNVLATNDGTNRGTKVYAYELTSDSGNPSIFGKANGLGDVELLSDAAPIEIGNRVWNDTNGNGIQDAGEAGIPNVTIELFADFDNNGVPDTYPATSCTSSGSSTAAPTAAVDNNCGGTITWATPANVYTANSSYATAGLTTNTQSHCLNSTGFGFAIPTGATITSVTAKIRKSATNASNVRDHTIQLLVGGVAAGTNQANVGTNWATTDADFTYGGTLATAWGGISLTPAEVNASNFGLTFRAQRIAGGTGTRTARIDYIELTVSYTTTVTTSAGTQIFTTTTSSTGEWVFNSTNVTNGNPTNMGCTTAGLVPNKRYVVRVGAADWTGGTGTGDLASKTLTTADADATTNGDLRDSDANLVSSTPTISIVVGNAGQNNHSLDMGFTTIGSVGNYVWNDLNSNGANDEAASAGINGVTVELWNATTNTLVNTTTTANNAGNPGYYNFVVTTSGNYYIKFPTAYGTKSLSMQTATAGTDGNSDANATTGITPTFAININGTGTAKDNPTIDAGYMCPGGCIQMTITKTR